MARELGMKPKKLGGKANHKQEPWKLPLSQYIEELYLRRFKKERPDLARSIEQMVADKEKKHTDRKERKRQHREDSHSENAVQPLARPDCKSAGVEKDEIPF
jgi:DNA gyrase/topoisomerase IV subunit B